MELYKKRFHLAIEVTQSEFGDYRLTSLDGPLADKMLCYAMLATAQASMRELQELRVIPEESKVCRVNIEVRRQPDGKLRLDRFEGPDDQFFVRGMLELARDGVQAGIQAVEKVSVEE